MVPTRALARPLFRKKGENVIQFLDPKVNPEGGPQMSKKIIGFGGRKCAFLARFPVTPSALALLHPMEFLQGCSSAKKSEQRKKQFHVEFLVEKKLLKNCFPKKVRNFGPKKHDRTTFFAPPPPSNEWRSRFNIFPVRGKILKMGVLEIALFRRKVVCERGRGRRFSGTCRTSPRKSPGSVGRSREFPGTPGDPRES